MIDPAYPALSKSLTGSLLWRAGTAMVDAVVLAWPSSVVGRVSASVRHTTDTSMVASIAALGGVLCVLLQQAVPQYIRPGLPWMWPLAAIATAAIVAVNGRAFERAWPHSRLARLVTRRQAP